MKKRGCELSSHPLYLNKALINFFKASITHQSHIQNYKLYKNNSEQNNYKLFQEIIF